MILFWLFIFPWIFIPHFSVLFPSLKAVALYASGRDLCWDQTQVCWSSHLGSHEMASCPCVPGLLCIFMETWGPPDTPWSPVRFLPPRPVVSYETVVHTGEAPPDFSTLLDWRKQEYLSFGVLIDTHRISKLKEPRLSETQENVWIRCQRDRGGRGRSSEKLLLTKSSKIKQISGNKQMYPTGSPE